MAVLYNSNLRKIILASILLWSGATFWFSETIPFLNWAIVIVGLLVLLLIYFERSPSTILIYLSFTSAFALYSFLYYFNLPLWVIMIGAFLIFGYLFLYTEQILAILGIERIIYLLIFNLIILELFIFLSYILIDPLNRSLIIGISSYLFLGYCIDYVDKDLPNRFLNFIYVFMVLLILILLTANWQI